MRIQRFKLPFLLVLLFLITLSPAQAVGVKKLIPMLQITDAIRNSGSITIAQPTGLRPWKVDSWYNRDQVVQLQPGLLTKFDKAVQDYRDLTQVLKIKPLPGGCIMDAPFQEDVGTPINNIQAVTYYRVVLCHPTWVRNEQKHVPREEKDFGVEVTVTAGADTPDFQMRATQRQAARFVGLRSNQLVPLIYGAQKIMAATPAVIPGTILETSVQLDDSLGGWAQLRITIDNPAETMALPASK